MIHKYYIHDVLYYTRYYLCIIICMFWNCLFACVRDSLTGFHVQGGAALVNNSDEARYHGSTDPALIPP